jgi:hypothetical protein
LGCKSVGVSFATPVFDGATEKDIKAQLKSANLPNSGKIQTARWRQRRGLRTACDRRLHLHAQN